LAGLHSLAGWHDTTLPGGLKAIRWPLAKSAVMRFPSLGFVVPIALTLILLGFLVRLPTIRIEWDYWPLTLSGIITALWVVAAFSVYRICISLLDSLTFSVLHHGVILLRPESDLISHLFAVVYRLVLHPSRWNDIVFKRAILRDLERSAQCMERYLPRSLTTYDASTEAWQRRRGMQMARSLRETKMWVIAPTSDTSHHLLHRMVHTLNSIASGNWDSVPRVDEEGSVLQSRFRAITARLWLLVLALARSAAVLGVALIVTRIPLGSEAEPLVTGENATYLMIVAVAYALLNFATSADPEFTTRVTTLREIIDLVRGTNRPEK
jgi:type IV secretory pathway VirB3-like protein